MNGLIIVLCRNSVGMTKQCLPTLLDQTLPVDVLAIDNASSDGTGSYLASQQQRHPGQVFRMSYQEVASVARCWNDALKWGWGRGHKEALVVNNDTELLPATYEKLAPHLHAHGQGVLTGVGVDREPIYPTTVVQSPHPDYSCFMIAAWAHRVVPFDQDYEGAYYEDNDHHVRLYRAGIPIASINVEFRHHRSSTLKHADRSEQARIHACSKRNRELFMEKYGCVPGTHAYAALFSAGIQIPLLR